MPTPPLLALPEDAARVLLACLDARDLEPVAAVNREAARDSYFQHTRDARDATLTLPWSNDDDGDRCRALLRGIHSRNPQRLASLQWIQVIAPWQAQLLLEDPVVADCIRSVRVRTTDARDSHAVTQICEKLCGLPTLQKLDVSSTPLNEVDVIARMTQLRELDLSRTIVTDVSALAALTELRVLVLGGTIAADLTCIENMVQLERLHVAFDKERERPRFARGERAAIIPSLRLLRHLGTLVLDTCSIESTADLIHVAPSLRHLELADVSCRHRNVVDESEQRPQHDVHEDELLARLVQLETIRLVSQDVLAPGSSTLAKIPSLRVIRHILDADIRPLAPLVNLEELSIALPGGDSADFATGEPDDYSVLARLPRLRKLVVTQATGMPWQWLPDMATIHERHIRDHTAALAEVLPRLSNLTSLDYSGYIPNDEFLPALQHLEHLGLRDCEPEIPSFDWIGSLRSLRSLELRVSTLHSDLSAISELPRLESLCLCDSTLDWEVGPNDHDRRGFLSQFVNLKALHLEGYMNDLEPLRAMNKLETLKIQSTNRYLDSTPIGTLDLLRVVDVAATELRDLTPFASLSYLREASVPDLTDCRPLIAANGPPRLLRVKHSQCDCVARCQLRDVLMQRELEGWNENDGDQGVSTVFGGGSEDY